MDRTYIGKVEAFEIFSDFFASTWDELPRKGMEYTHVPIVTTLDPIIKLGKDDKGFYTVVHDQYLTNS